jgi:hypothetical protein
MAVTWKRVAHSLNEPPRCSKTYQAFWSQLWNKVEIKLEEAITITHVITKLKQMPRYVAWITNSQFMGINNNNNIRNKTRERSIFHTMAKFKQVGNQYWNGLTRIVTTVMHVCVMIWMLVLRCTYFILSSSFQECLVIHSI